jgi:hypothetical protein
MKPLALSGRGSVVLLGACGRALRRSAARGPVSGVLVSLCLSCAFFQSDPVHDAAVQALGPEQPGVPKGPYHRAGQPCTVCHSPEGPAHTVFAIAGTVFSSASVPPSQEGPIGVNGASVGVVDDDGAQFVVTSNCVGNFFVTTSVFNPAFPILVNVSMAGAGVVSMVSHIGRDGSCASCHSDPPSASSPGHLYLPTSAPASDPSCPVSPVAKGL